MSTVIGIFIPVHCTCREKLYYLSLQDGSQAILLAVCKGQLEIVEYLLDEAGVSPRVQLKVWLTRSSEHLLL